MARWLVASATAAVRCAWLVAASLVATVNIAGSQPAQAQEAAEMITITGSVAYRQRMAMPPEAIMTVRIEDVSRADAKATLVAETIEPFGARQVPIPFTLAVPRSAIDARARYTLRATITVGGELRFTTDTHQPVLSAGAPEKIHLMLVQVAATAPVVAPGDKPSAAAVPAMASTMAATAAPTLAFAMPATFTGVLPCADCVGVAHTLTLRDDGLYRLRRTYLGKPAAPVAELGRWSADATGQKITLGRDQRKMMLAVADAQTLRQLDHAGQPINSAANLELRRTAQVDAITEPLRWVGEFSLFAGSPTFTDCASGLHWPVAMAGDYLALEQRYGRDRSAPGAGLLVSFDGRLEMRPAMEGPSREHVVVDRLGTVDAGAVCADQPGLPPVTAASLKDTYWKLIELDGGPVPVPPAQQREVRLTLASAGTRVFGFSGCNNLVGSYELDGTSLRFIQRRFLG